MKKIIVLHTTTVLILFCGIASSFGQTVSDEARAKRYFARGVAAVEMAKSPSDYESAIKEFSRAAALAPDWPDVYYNLGLVQEKAEKYNEAVTSFKQYIRLAPNSSDAETVKTLIYKLEYKRDQEEGVKRVYEMMTYSTNILVVPNVSWKKISEKGDKEPDWEIDHNNDFDNSKLPEYRGRAIFDMTDGSLSKISYIVRHMELFIRQIGYSNIPVDINGKFFEYRYPVEMNWICRYMKDGTPVYDYKTGGELSIKGEIISVDPPRVKREQTVKWPDGRTSVTEFVYELIVKNKNVVVEYVVGPTLLDVSTFGWKLHDAAWLGSMDIAKKLIDRGKDINARNNDCLRRLN